MFYFLGSDNETNCAQEFCEFGNEAMFCIHRNDLKDTCVFSAAVSDKCNLTHRINEQSAQYCPVDIRSFCAAMFKNHSGAWARYYVEKCPAESKKFPARISIPLINFLFLYRQYHLFQVLQPADLLRRCRLL